jgi:hypothetical protein
MHGAYYFPLKLHQYFYECSRILRGQDPPNKKCLLCPQIIRGKIIQKLYC